MRASLVDLAFAAFDGPKTPAHVAVCLTFAQGLSPSLKALESGAERARTAYPRSTQRLDGAVWKPSLHKAPPIAEDSGPDVAAATRRFLAQPFELSRGGCPAQALIRGPDGTCTLVTRMHHAQGDMLSVFLWLLAQLEGCAAKPLQLRTHPRPARRSVFAPVRPSEAMLGGDAACATGVRAWHHLAFCPAGKGDGYTWNDLLAAIALSTVEAWNTERGGGERIALWMPVGARVQPFEGFGNGSGRIRLYARPAQGFVAQARSIREQVRWAKESGEWATPSWASALAWAPNAWVRRMLLRQASSPDVDMGTTLFTHLQRLVPEGAVEPLAHVERVELIAHLLPAHPMALSAMGHHGQTHLTFTWDEGRFSRAEAQAFIALFEATRLRAFAEVRGG